MSTTLEHLYKQEFDSSLASYREKSMAPLNTYSIPEYQKDQIMTLLNAEKVLIQMNSELSACKVPTFTFDIKSRVDEHFSKREIQNTQQKSTLLDECEAAKQRAEEEYNAQVEATKKHNEALANPYRDKHAELLTHKKNIGDVCTRYNISPLDMHISDSLSKDEFETLIDGSIAICEKYERKDNGIFDKVVQPLKGEGNLQFVACYLLIGIALLYFTLPILSVAVFAIMIASTYGMYKDLEKLKIAIALMAQIDYNRFVENDKLTLPDKPDLAAIDEEYQNKVDAIGTLDAEREKANVELASESTDVEKQILTANQEVKDAYAGKLKQIRGALEDVQKYIGEIMKDYKPFPTVQNNSAVMNHSYTLGRIDDRLDVQATLPQCNAVFDSTSYQTGVDLMKLYLCNALLSVRVKSLTVDIYDPEGLCRDFAEFFKPETQEYIKTNIQELNKLLDTYKSYSLENIRRLNHKDIDTFNKEAEEKEMVTLNYKLLLMISGIKKLKENESGEAFKEYFKHSAETGVMIWILDKEKWTGSIWVNGDYTLQNGRALVYSMALGEEAVKTYITALENYKDGGIAYKERFGDKYLPREKWWTYDTIKGIDLYFGLEEGDPSRGFPMTLGDANVHAIMGGATGAGKSAAINQLLISLITKYPPSELMIILVDFKNVEAAKFTAGYVQEEKRWMTKEEEKALRDEGKFYTRLSRIPHLQLISGTTDGEYALSIFEYLMKEMIARQQIINKFGVTKVQEMREQILSQYNLEHNGDKKKGTWADMRKDWDWYKPNVYDKYGDLPRLLVLFDEFQVMYNTEFVPQRTIDAINGKITALTKLARAMGCHLFFTSQSMKGTMSKDTMDNFSLRGALRCTTEVSESLLGNKAAGTITAKFGFMYTNDSAGQDAKKNKFWRVPFLDEKLIPSYINPMYDMLEEFNEKHRMAEFYDEKILVPSSHLYSWFREYGSKFSDPDSFIFGERAAYSINKAPVATTLIQDAGENILIGAFERDDMLNLTLTITDNLLMKDGATIVMSVMDKDCYTLLDVESIVQPELISIAGPEQDTEEFIDAIQEMVDRRMTAGGENPPVYVVCVSWENAPGISIQEKPRLQDKLKLLLRQGPRVSVHFVFAFKDKPPGFVSFIPQSCAHKIIGLMPNNALWFTPCSKVEKLPDKSKDAGLFAMYLYGTQEVKFRIYQHTYKNTIKSRDIVIE